MKTKKAFALIELLTVMGVIAILFSLSVPQLFRLQNRNTLQNAEIKLISLIRQQQLLAMNSPNTYGIYFEQAQYTQFMGPNYSSSNSSNIVTPLDYPTQFSQVDFPLSTLQFATGSGEIYGFDSSHHSITIIDSVHNEQHTIQLNKLGVPTVQ